MKYTAMQKLEVASRALEFHEGGFQATPTCLLVSDAAAALGLPPTAVLQEYREHSGANVCGTGFKHFTEAEWFGLSKDERRLVRWTSLLEWRSACAVEAMQEANAAKRAAPRYLPGQSFPQRDVGPFGALLGV